MAAPRHKSPCFSGQTVPVTGIYRVQHVEHRGPHEVVAVQGERFPGCRECRDQVTFTLVRPASYMTEDMDLAGPLWDGDDEEDQKDLAS
jgi:hypothetical protein